jgi:uncharacterized OB-fold protein
MRLSEPQNTWHQCQGCNHLHQADDRVWAKHYGLEMSGCPRCGSVFMVPSAIMKRQLNLFERVTA